MTGRRQDRRPRVELDLTCQISPYTVYRRLAEGEELFLVDLRAEPAGPRPPTLREALGRPGEDWRPPADVDVVLLDQDGRGALVRARELRSQGHDRVKALFGGLDLWDLALGGMEDREKGEVV